MRHVKSCYELERLTGSTWPRGIPRHLSTLGRVRICECRCHVLIVIEPVSEGSQRNDNRSTNSPSTGWHAATQMGMNMGKLYVRISDRERRLARIPVCPNCGVRCTACLHLKKGQGFADAPKLCCLIVERKPE